MELITVKSESPRCFKGIYKLITNIFLSGIQTSIAARSQQGSCSDECYNNGRLVWTSSSTGRTAEVDSHYTGLHNKADRIIWRSGSYHRKWIAIRYGLPHRIMCDNGNKFISAIIPTITSCLGITPSFTLVYHPEKEPAERRNMYLKTQIAIQLITESMPNHKLYANRRYVR